MRPLAAAAVQFAGSLRACISSLGGTLRFLPPGLPACTWQPSASQPHVVWPRLPRAGPRGWRRNPPWEAPVVWPD
eukprot:5118456-Prymnesium_polylepis.1